MQPIELPGELESLKLIRDFIKMAAADAGLDKKRTYRLILAVDEIATNSIVHGYGEAEMDGDLVLWAEITDRSLTIVIEDSAPPYAPPESVESEELESPLEERQLGGIGVFLAIHNVDEFRYEHLEARNRHTFIMNSMFSTVEKTAILKKVRLFAETPQSILSELAQIIEETEAVPGEIVFSKGEQGASMYIVASGRVRLHVGERTVEYLGENELFGETAPIAPGERRVSVTALEETRFLRLESGALYGLFDTHVGVAQKVVQLLTRRLLARVQELDDLRIQMEEVILPLGIALSQEDNLDGLLERILVETKSFCNADAGTIYLMTEDGHLEFSCVRTDSLGISLGGTTGQTITFPPLPLYQEASGEPNFNNVATYVALKGHSIHIPNIYDTSDFDFSATREIDLKNGYRSVSSFTVPLKNHEGEVEGVLQLFNAQDPVSGEIVAFDPYQQLVVESLASQAAIALNTQMLLERQKGLLKYESDIQTARQIQTDFLPDSLPQPEGWEIVALCEPARDVAGDFYDAFTLSQKRRVCFVIADVVDKGVPAALFMALTRSLTRAFAQQHYSIDWTAMLSKKGDSGRIRRRGRQRSMTGTIALKNAVTLTNNYILDNHVDLNMFATLFIGMVDPRNGELAYINAGHNPPFIIGADGTLKATLNPSGPAVGMLSGFDFEIEFAKFDPGDVLFAYTDGVTEARSPTREFYSEKRLLDGLSHPAISATEVVDRIAGDVHAFIGEAERFDDITMIAVQRKPGD